MNTAITHSGRRYRFAEHSAAGYPPSHRGISHRDAVTPFTLDGIINRENLVRTFKRCRKYSGTAPGVDGIRFSDFSITEFGTAVDVAIRSIREQRWKPRPSRSLSFPKVPMGHRRIDIRCVVDRVISAAVADVVTRKLESVLLPRVMGFRPGRGIYDLLANVTFAIESEGYVVVAQADIADAFPSLRINDVMRDYASFVDDSRLCHLIEVILRGNRNSQIGIEQGDPLSPPTLNLRLHHCLDLPSSRTTDSDFPLRFRYVDDNVYLTRSVSEGQSAVASDSALLLDSGFHFKRKGTYPVDLRRAGSSITMLGFRVQLDSGQLRFDLEADKELN